MRKKELIRQNAELFENLQKTKKELKEVKDLLAKNNADLSALKEQLKAPALQQEPTTQTEPLRRLEEKVISNATLKPDVEYGSKVIGKIVVSSAEYSNKLTLGGDDKYKELVNLILGKTEMAKAEILAVIQSDDGYDLKCSKMDRIAEVTNEYFESVIAQIF